MSNKNTNSMVRQFTQDEWKLISDIVTSSRNLEEALNAKGFEVINTFSTGLYPACITFIVKRNFTEIMSVSVLDIVAEQKRVEVEIFRRGEEILNTDYKALEIKMLRDRLAQLEEHKGGCC